VSGLLPLLRTLRRSLTHPHLDLQTRHGYKVRLQCPTESDRTGKATATTKATAVPAAVVDYRSQVPLAALAWLTDSRVTRATSSPA
jgi:hypothetical protein